MIKEAIICIVSILIIILGNNISNSYAKTTMEEATPQLEGLKQYVNGEEVDNNIAKNKMEQIDKFWYEKNTVLAYFIEHDELEKVETSLAEIKSNIEIEEYNQAVVEIDKCKYIIYHIENKEEFKLENIF